MRYAAAGAKVMFAGAGAIGTGIVLDDYPVDPDGIAHEELRLVYWTDLKEEDFHTIDELLDITGQEW